MSNPAEKGPSSEDWAQRYVDGDTPWNVEGGHPELIARLRSPQLTPSARSARALVPGCGLGHDAIALARAGWAVTAIDIVDTFAEELSETLEPLDGRFIVTDALAFDSDEPFDLVWEHTFFCAINPDQRGDYGAMIRRVTAPGSQVAVLVFPIGRPRTDGGPPWGVTTADYASALGEKFELVMEVPVENRLQRRSWSEHFALFRRNE